MKNIIIFVTFLLLVGCTKYPDSKDNYKILWGNRCTESGNQYSYMWFHTVYGPDQVKKEWCR